MSAPAPSLRTRSLLSTARKQVIVTGGASGIGRALISALNECGEENIVIVDQLGAGEKWRNLLGLRFGDLIDPETFVARVREDRAPMPTTLFNLLTTREAETRDTDQLITHNYRQARELCEWCLKCGGRFIHTSTAATYGDGSGGWFDAHDNLAALQPLDPFAFSKHFFDLWSLRSGTLDRIATLKLFDAYGPGEDNSPVQLAIRAIRDTGELTLLKGDGSDMPDGGQQRDFVHTRDVAEMLLFLHEHPEANGLFNAGSGAARTMLDLASILFAAMGIEPAIRFIDTPVHERGRVQSFSQAELSKLRAAGYGSAFTSLEEGVSDCVRSQPPGASAPVRM